MKAIYRTAAAFTALIAAAGLFPSGGTSALSADAYSIEDIVSAVREADRSRDDIERMTDNEQLCIEQYNDFRTTDKPVIDTSGLPERFDLRNAGGKNYVSPVKDQGAWGTCWSFSAVAAAAAATVRKRR